MLSLLAFEGRFYSAFLTSRLVMRIGMRFSLDEKHA